MDERREIRAVLIGPHPDIVLTLTQAVESVSWLRPEGEYRHYCTTDTGVRIYRREGW
jgi:hypothetical protein